LLWRNGEAMRTRDASINRNVSFSILGGDLIRTVAAQGRPDIIWRYSRNMCLESYLFFSHDLLVL
jgi:hypothetical protein